MHSALALQPFLAVSTGLIIGGALLAVILIIGISVISMYNGLVRLRVTSKESWSDIDTELQRRHDLIPNLISTVKGYASHEKELFEKVTELRNQAVEARNEDPGKRAGVEDMLEGSVGKLVATAEAYPDLKANQNFLELQKELGETETRIARARRFYNSNVRSFRTAVMTFPKNVIAGMFGFQSSEFSFFEASAGDREAVQVDAADFS
ncbi:MAG: hypothetical protein CMJ34_03130 [Phycisphaerae bacterium]|nr:hypothetical protein [Phycisphaerae bacterium]